MTIEVLAYPSDIPLSEAMIVWTRGDRVGVVPHPDKRGISESFNSSAGACYAYWRELDDVGRKLQLMIECHHISAFYGIPTEAIHRAFLCIPEYRDMLADDCLPAKYRDERFEREQ